MEVQKMLRRGRLPLIVVLFVCFCLILSFSHSYASEKYAVLISAGKSPGDYDCTGSSYWYDLFLMYEALIGLGYTHDHIYVLYANGSDFDSRHPRFSANEFHPEWPDQITDYNNYKATIDTFFGWLGPVITEDDDLFVWWMGHGSHYGDCNDVEFLIENTYEKVRDYEFKGYLDNISNYRTRVISFMTCFSGGIIDEFMNDTNTIVSTSSNCELSSYMGSGESPAFNTFDGSIVRHSEYNYNLACALAGKDALGNPIDPASIDLNGDMITDMQEVLSYLWDNKTKFGSAEDSWCSYPQFYDSSGIADHCTLLNTYRCTFVDKDAPGIGDGSNWYNAYTTIQSALNNAPTNNLVLVADGIYYESGIRFNGKPLTLKSLKGPDSTIINGNNSNSVFIFNASEDADSIVDGFTITNGHPQYYGGGIYCGTNSSPTIRSCNIEQNTAAYGGGIYCSASSPNISNCKISDNHVSSYAGGIFCTNSSPNIGNCTISDNSSSYYAGGIECLYYSNPSITNCIINGNSCNYSGGGIWCNNHSSPSIANCTIINNSGRYGGGIYCLSYSSPVITNTILARNDASWYGGALCSRRSQPQMINCTITDNDAYLGGGLYIYWDYPNSPIIKNCILWNDSPDEIYLYSGNPIVTYSDVQYAYGIYPGTGNIKGDPQFFDPDDPINPDYRICRIHDYADPENPIPYFSPCENAGTETGAPNIDRDYMKRIVDPSMPWLKYDIGAYECYGLFKRINDD